MKNGLITVALAALFMVILSGFGMINRSLEVPSFSGFETTEKPTESVPGYKGRLERYLRDASSDGAG